MLIYSKSHTNNVQLIDSSDDLERILAELS